MPTKTATPKKSRKKNASKPKPAAKTKKKEKSPLLPSEERFIRDLLIRGEAVEISPGEELPPDATHRIISNDEDDLPQVERERFSLF